MSGLFCSWKQVELNHYSNRSINLNLLQGRFLKDLKTHPHPKIDRKIKRDPIYLGALIIRAAFRRNWILRDRQDPYYFPMTFLFERYRFSRQGIIYLQQLIGPKILLNLTYCDTNFVLDYVGLQLGTSPIQHHGRNDIPLPHWMTFLYLILTCS